MAVLPLAHAWPVDLVEGPTAGRPRVRLRPLRMRDAAAYAEVRAANTYWLRPWDATSPDQSHYHSYGQMRRDQNRSGRRGESIPLVIEVDGRLAGQISLTCVVWGSMRGGALGYWIDSRLAGRSITPTAVAMLTDHVLLGCGMHRVEVNIRPENHASLRVVEKLGFRDEGLRQRFLHIDGDWRDHRTFALTVEEIGTGLLPRLRSSWQPAQP